MTRSKKSTPKRSTPKKAAPKKKAPKQKLKATAPAKPRPPQDVVVRAADKWAREAAMAEVRRLASASRGSWLSVEVPFQPNHFPPADGL